MWSEEEIDSHSCLCIHKMTFWAVSPDPGAKTLHSHCRGLSSIPCQETRTHMPQIRVPIEKVPQAQPNKYLEKINKPPEAIPEKQNTWLTVEAAGP